MFRVAEFVDMYHGKAICWFDATDLSLEINIRLWLVRYCVKYGAIWTGGGGTW